MPDYYFHYTSRENAQSIFSSGRMEAGVSGWIYLSLDAYDQGAHATDALAIEGKPIDVVALIPTTAVNLTQVVSLAWPLYDPVTGRIRRHGGGSEVRAPGPIPVTPARWMALSPP